MFHIIVKSINGGEERYGRMEFISPSLAAQYVERELRSLTCYCQVWIKNRGGERVVQGRRDGFNGTGKNWIWERAS
ncbi:hypothetical protein [Salinispora pacifica]|uniref:hypothetical protein n=1 Tax=Salinispora pacifica TaxID=351187 RepID=UPI00037BCE17|nr:hypothetical protein [Salinispora pacifica]